MLQRTGEAETITTHYLFALGTYRALYIPNWLYRYFAEGHVDRISWLAGIVQTVLYLDFFWIYYTKYNPCHLCLSRTQTNRSKLGCYKAKNSISPFEGNIRISYEWL